MIIPTSLFRMITVPLLVLVAVSTSLFPVAHATTGITGTIAYVSGDNAIHLIQPDGSHDHAIWTEPASGTPDFHYDIADLAWRPDARELAFTSNHEEISSLYNRDVYAIQPDGTGLRRLTNSPDVSALNSFPKGTVTVDVTNQDSTRSLFFVYITGAPEAQTAVIAQGTTVHVTFTNVADFGNVGQSVIVISGLERFYSASSYADVKVGQTVAAGQFFITSQVSEEFGATDPSWRRDSAQLDFIFNGCTGMKQLPVHPPAGSTGQFLPSASTPPFACRSARGPTAALANQILYTTPSFSDNSIYRVTEGSTDAGTLLLSFDSTTTVYDLQWLPDGSGFLFSQTDGVGDSANIYEYTFASQAVTQQTHFTNEFAGHFDISPDGQSIVFERAATATSSTALWIMQRNGSGMHLLVQNAQRPSWSHQTPQSALHVYVPLLKR